VVPHGFIGAVTWRERARWDRRVLADLAAARAVVPGAAGARPIGVSRTGFAAGVEPDRMPGPEDLLAAR
jgi:hypothetical protein